MGIKRRSKRQPDKDKARSSGLFIALLILIVWLPLPSGSNSPWAWAIMEVWIFLMAALWLLKFARGQVAFTESFRQARTALILLGLWLGYGLLQMMPLPASVVAVITPTTAALYNEAQLAPQLADHALVPNPVERPLPSFPDNLATLDQPVGESSIESTANDHAFSVVNESNIAWADTHELLQGILPNSIATGGNTARITLDLSASVTAWLKSLAYVLIFVLTLLLVDSQERLKTLAHVIVLSALGQAIYGSLALAAAGGGVASGSFINRNHFAAYLVLGLSVGIGLLVATMGKGGQAISWRHRLRRIGELVLSSKAPLRIFLAIMVIALVLTHSRMGNSSFFASLLIAGTLALFLFKEMPRPVMILIASLIVIDLIIIGSWVGIDQVKERLVETTLEQETRDETSLHTFRLWRDYPLLGAGAGSFYSVFPRYREGDEGQGFYDHAHNDYLEFLSEYGILGIVFPAGVVILALLNAINAQRRRRSQFARGLGFAALMAITAMLIHAAVEFNLQIPAYAATFMVILAMSWHARYLRSENQQHT